MNLAPIGPASAAALGLRHAARSGRHGAPSAASCPASATSRIQPRAVSNPSTSAW